jgi:FkbM family methyltransferase
MSVAARPADEACAPRSEFLSRLVDDQHDGRLGGRRSNTGERSILNRLQRVVRETVTALAARIGYHQPAPVTGTSDDVAFIAGHLAEFEWLYRRLANDASRGVLLALLRARMLGQPYRHPTQEMASYRQLQRSVASDLLMERDTRKPWHPYLNRYCIPGVQGKLVLQTDEHTMLHTVRLEQYAYRHDDTPIRAKPGDIVIDGGSHHGAAALYFADLVGPAGHIYAIDLSAGNVALTGENLVLNPRLQAHVTVVERALNDDTGDRVFYRPSGPSVSPVRIDQWGTLSAETETISIDDFVEQHALQRVDLIRLDIGGWERRVLSGARRTLDVKRPALAVSVAHQLADMIDTTAFLDEVTDGYVFYLDDVTPHGGHPILFARPAVPKVRR